MNEDVLVKWCAVVLIVFIIAVACILIFSPLVRFPS